MAVYSKHYCMVTELYKKRNCRFEHGIETLKGAYIKYCKIIKNPYLHILDSLVKQSKYVFYSVD